MDLYLRFELLICGLLTAVVLFGLSWWVSPMVIDGLVSYFETVIGSEVTIAYSRIFKSSSHFNFCFSIVAIAGIAFVGSMQGRYAVKEDYFKIYIYFIALIIGFIGYVLGAIYHIVNVSNKFHDMVNEQGQLDADSLLFFNAGMIGATISVVGARLVMSFVGFPKWVYQY